MSWNNYIEEYGIDAEYDDTTAWEIRINDKTVKTFETKEETLYHLIEEIDNLTNNKFFDSIKLIGYYNEDDLLYSLIEMNAIDFYEEIEKICETFDINEEIKMINLDNDEPEFGEL